MPQSCNSRGHILPWDCMRVAPCQSWRRKCKERKGKGDPSGGVWLKAQDFQLGVVEPFMCLCCPFLLQAETSMVEEIVNQCQLNPINIYSKYQKE